MIFLESGENPSPLSANRSLSPPMTKATGKKKPIDFSRSGEPHAAYQTCKIHGRHDPTPPHLSTPAKTQQISSAAAAADGENLSSPASCLVGETHPHCRASEIWASHAGSAPSRRQQISFSSAQNPEQLYIKHCSPDLLIANLSH
ncbi:hypothetical protein ACLOJK_030849 [Asimina triloba]